MRKFLLVNWTNSREMRGGCETVFDGINNILKNMGHETKLITFNQVKNILGIGIERKNMNFFEIEASHVIDRYCSHYTRLFPDTRIISNGGITNFWYKNRNTINIFNDPYKAIVDRLMRLGLHGATEYNKYGNILVRMQQESARNAKNVAISGFMENEMRNMGIEPDKKIPHGIDLNKFTPARNRSEINRIREKYDIPSDATVITWSKDFNPVAGFHIIAHLVNKFPEIYWVLQFKNKIDYKPKNSNVRLLRPRTRDEMPEIYKMADFCINPSVAESFGLVPLEAMACGLPVITTNTGFLWEKNMDEEMIKRNYGVLVNRWNAKSFERAVNMALDSDNFSPRKTAKQYSKERWEKSWKDFIEQLSK